MEETSILIGAFRQLPVYLSTFAKLVSSPIKFIKQEIDDESTDSLAKALMFASVSTLIAIIAMYVLTPRTGFFIILLINTLVYIIEVICFVFIVSISFKMVGVNVNTHMILVAVLYYVGIVSFISAIQEFLDPGIILTVFLFCLFMLPNRALALSANLNSRQGIGVAVILAPAYFAVCWVVGHISSVFFSSLLNS